MGNGDTTFIHERKKVALTLGGIVSVIAVVWLCAGAYHELASKLDRIENSQLQQVTVSDFETWIYWVERANDEITLPSIREVWQIRRDIIRDRRGNEFLGSATDANRILGAMIDAPRVNPTNKTNESDQPDR